MRAAPRPATLIPEQVPRFERWYGGYPNKQHRPEAERAWARLAPDEATTAALCADVERRRAGRKWRDGYIEHPATYLTNRVWEDDIETPRPPARAGPNGRKAAISEQWDQMYADQERDDEQDADAGVLEAAWRVGGEGPGPPHPRPLVAEVRRAPR